MQVGMLMTEGLDYCARYYDPNIGRFISEDPLGFGGDGTNFYAYARNDPIDNDDPTGCGSGPGDCAKALADLARAVDELARRLAENAAASKCDKGHDKAIEQARQRVQNALAKARNCSQAEVQRILDQLRMWDQSLVNGIVQWLNNPPQQNWPGIYGPMPGTPGAVPPPPVLPPVPVIP